MDDAEAMLGQKKAKLVSHGIRERLVGHQGLKSSRP
jgi:hypothetical protein